jgi:hypothetical protein
MAYGITMCGPKLRACGADVFFKQENRSSGGISFT